MIVLALYNLKGGVGKTASAVNLAHLAALDGYRTLIWDLDPQGAASFYFRVKPKLRGGRKALLRRKNRLDEHLRGTDFERLDLLPADFSLRKMDIALEELKKPSQRIARLLEPLEGDYDFVFLDCPPSISVTSENVFAASTALLVPTIPTTLSLRTLEQLRGHLLDRGPEDLPVWPFFSMVDRRKNMHREILEAAASSDADYLSSHLPYASEVEKMGIERNPVLEFSASGPATRAYVALWGEVLERLGQR